MRADVARADRLHAVRSAAEGWRRARAIEDATLRSIVAAYPDDRARLGLGLRILAALAALIGGGALAGLSFTILDYPFPTWLVAAGLASGFTLATELQVGRLRRAQAGAEYSTALLASIFSALVWPLLRSSSAPIVVTTLLAVTFALAAWRWGHPSLAALAAVLALSAAAQGPYGRAVWILSGIAAIPIIHRAARSPRWAPLHRECFLVAGLVLLAGAYVAMNVYSFDLGWLEGGGRLRVLAIAGTVLTPPLALFAGVRRRQRPLLAAGALFTAASLVTLRHYHPILPWWLSLILGGTATLVGAVALRRWLDTGLAHERSGFTAEPLFEDRRAIETAQTAATIAAMSPVARVAEQAGFEGGGGRSGGRGSDGGSVTCC